jgi:predicted O-linked N-acetylglucosamine transferase (SPINDLY family)
MLLKQAFADADAGRIVEAAHALAAIILAFPNHPEALHELGMLHNRCGRPAEGIKLLTRAADAAPGNLRYRFNLALLMLRSGKPPESVPHFLRAADLASENRDAGMLDTIGAALREAGHLTAASETYRRSIAFRGNDAGVHNRLGLALQEQGKLDEALAATGRALEIDPAFADAIGNTLLTLNYHDRFTPEEIFQEHQRLAARLAPAAPPARPVRKPQLPSAGPTDGRMRIGYLSPDFCQHSVAFFIWPILAQHDREKILVTCYSDVAKPDVVTQDLMRLSERWRPIHGKSNDEVAKLIADDGIDILIDLAGHTRGNRMPLFARRAGGAPIQVTYLGYPNTTGLSTVDYRITDELADPVGQTESLHSEKLIRLPAPSSFFCFLTPKGYPEVTPPPAEKGEGAGGVTFLVATNFAKVRPHMMELWAKILEATQGGPRSRLIIQARALDDPQTRAATERFFAERGVGADRLELRGWSDFPQFLRQLGGEGGVDIALDTFPFVNHTASCNLLWMGIPVITLAGVAHRSRMGVSILTGLGLSDLIAQSDDDYVRIARELAADLPRLRELRMGMRQRMLNSPLMDAPGFVRHLEAAYEQMLRESSSV